MSYPPVNANYLTLHNLQRLIHLYHFSIPSCCLFLLPHRCKRKCSIIPHIHSYFSVAFLLLYLGFTVRSKKSYHVAHLQQPSFKVAKPTAKPLAFQPTTAFWKRLVVGKTPLLALVYILRPYNAFFNVFSTPSYAFFNVGFLHYPTLYIKNHTLLVCLLLIPTLPLRFFQQFPTLVPTLPT